MRHLSPLAAPMLPARILSKIIFCTAPNVMSLWRVCTELVGILIPNSARRICVDTVLLDYRLTGGSSTENILLDSTAAPGLQAQQKEVSVSPAVGKILLSIRNKVVF